MAFTEFYCDAASGSNINAGDGKSIVTSTNGDWNNAAANRFTAASGTPFSGVSVGDFASVYLDGATVGVYIARVTAVNAGGASIDLSTSAKSGTAPTAGASGRSCTTGGAWKGPNAAEKFPFDFITSALQNIAADVARINMKSGTNYSITASVTHAINGPLIVRGYTTTAGDGGRATIDGGTSGASYILFNPNSAALMVRDLIFQNNGATGSAEGVKNTAGASFACCVVNSVRGQGFTTPAAAYYDECEAYSCNQSNTANFAGFYTTAIGTHYRACIAHDNTGGNTNGFSNLANGGCIYDACIADTNGLRGMYFDSAAFNSIVGCDLYNNGTDGIRIANANSRWLIENCNFVKNGGYGINDTQTSNAGIIRNCGFGSGTAANSSGDVIATSRITQESNVNYGSNLLPWVDAPNGDFRINLAAAKGAGRGAFLQTASSYTGAVGYPDIGAAQHQDSGGGGGPLIGGRLAV